MKIVILDGEKISSKANVHEIFAKALDFPEYYGKNLDALHDILTEHSEEIGVIAVNVEKLSENLGKWWKSLLRLLSDVSEEKKNFSLCIDPFKK